MGFSISQKSIEVVVFQDDALAMSRDEYEHYLMDVRDQSRLNYAEGKSWEDCTKFVLQLNLSYDVQKRISKEQMQISVNPNDPTATQALMDMSYQFTEMRASLINIINPPDLINTVKYRKDRKDGMADPEIVSMLSSAGAMRDLLTARSNVMNASTTNDLQKKK